MRRFVTIATVAGLLALALFAPEAAAQKKKKKPKPAAPVKVTREVEFDYQCPCIGRYQLGSLGVGNIGGGAVPLGADEVWLTAVATDQSGMAIPVNINQDTNGDGLNDSVGTFCGETEAPLQLSTEREIRIFVGDPAICPGPALGGTIVFTLSNLP